MPAIFAAAGHRVVTIPGSERAFKITVPADLARAEELLRGGAELRTGIGVDVHAFSDGVPLWLGGVHWPGLPGLAGHSDGDAACHAIVDALLAAAGLGDIGSVFGTDDPRYAGASGATFIREAVAILADAGWAARGVSVEIVANEPRIGPRRAELERELSALVGAPVTVAGTTSDGLGLTGGGGGVAAIATALLSPLEQRPRRYACGVNVRLYDTKAREIVDLVPRVPGRIGMYVCGPTVQSSPHIGHLRSALVYDLWRRWLEHHGLDVTLVRNVTDIDDKILAASDASGDPERWWALAYRVELEFTAAYAAIGILPPTYEPRATASIGEMQALIAELIAAGHAYPAQDGSGDVYFDTGSWPAYGSLTNQRREDMQDAEDAGPPRQAGPPRLRALEGSEVRRAGECRVAIAVGRWPAGLAHRVLGDGEALPRRGVRHPRRRARPALPASRERARPVDRGRRRVRAPLAPQRPRQRRRPEDVEVARQLDLRVRRARTGRSGRRPLPARGRPLPLDDRPARRLVPRGPPRRSTGSRPSSSAPAVRSRAPAPRRCPRSPCRRPSRPRWTTI